MEYIALTLYLAVGILLGIACLHCRCDDGARTNGLGLIAVAAFCWAPCCLFVICCAVMGRRV
jgi:hypothetical protein